jgi:hypothetical protein
MRAATLAILLVILIILFSTKQIFWILAGAGLLLAYSFASAARTASRGIQKTLQKTKATYAGELTEFEKATGKYPAKFFDSVGKAAAEKITEGMVPPKAKSYRDAENFVWKPKEKNPGILASDIANKILDSFGKIFSK